MINVVADNKPYLFNTVCDHLQLKWNPTIEGRRSSGFQRHTQNSADCNYRRAMP